MGIINVTHVGAAATNAAAAAIIAADAEAAVQVAAQEIKSYEEGRPYRVNREGQIELLEKLQNQPTWRRGDVLFHEALGFAKFVDRFRNGSTVIFADGFAETPAFTAILDYHEAGGSQNDGAKWDLFRAVLPLRHTESWQRWDKADGTEMAQADFALFLEENIPDVASPDGAVLVEIARTLEAAVGVNWQSHIRADNGQHRFSFLETVQGNAQTTKDGKVDIPAEFTLALAPFEGSKRYQVGARLRYRITGGQVKLWFVLVRAEDVLTEAFNDELLKIDTQLNGVTGAAQPPTPIYKGPAPKPLTPPAAANA